MKTLLLAALSIFAISCTAPEDESHYIPQVYKPDCGTIVASGEDQRGDYIEVKMPGYNNSQHDRYKVANYLDYHLGKSICNFAGLTKQAN